MCVWGGGERGEGGDVSSGYSKGVEVTPGSHKMYNQKRHDIKNLTCSSTDLTTEYVLLLIFNHLHESSCSIHNVIPLYQLP